MSGCDVQVVHSDVASAGMPVVMLQRRAGQSACLGEEQVGVGGCHYGGEQLAVPAQLGKSGAIHLFGVLQQEHGT